MSICLVAPVEREPEVTLINWTVFQSSTGERHFAGHCIENGTSRFSTAIAVFDPATQRGITHSGRVYLLKGPSGHDSDAAYVMNQIAAARCTAFIDVSSQMMSSPYIYSQNNQPWASNLNKELFELNDELLIGTAEVTDPSAENPLNHELYARYFSKAAHEFLNSLERNMAGNSHGTPLSLEELLGQAEKLIDGMRINIDRQLWPDDE